MFFHPQSLISLSIIHFCLVKFAMDLHPYDTKRHDSYHAHMPGTYIISLH